MVFSDTSKNLGLIQDITFLTKTNTTNYPTADRTRNINNWYSKVVSWIIQANGRWKWDDSNQTNRPTATANLVDGQQDYSVINKTPDADQDWLQIDRVDILDSDGNGIKLLPIDQSDIGMALSEFNETDGTPKYFDFNGSNIFLYPAPNYDKASGLVASFNRAPLAFADTDTTKKAGFASIFHRVLSLGASYDWALVNSKNMVSNLREEIAVMKEDIKKHYGTRDKYEIKKIARAYQNFK